jgi:hypothetical protein
MRRIERWFFLGVFLVLMALGQVYGFVRRIWRRQETA